MLLEIKNVSKRLGSFRLEQISAELPEGYIMGLIGPNGAGKTTLIHLILGLYRPGEGEILVDGRDYATAEREIREEIGTVLQERLFDPTRTLRQNGDHYGCFYRCYDSSILDAYLIRFGLEPERSYRELSKGEELKFQLAFALAHTPRLLVMDEPAGNFDPKFRDEFFKVLKEYISDGKRSVIISTHQTDDLEQIADYITYLEKGSCLISTDIETLRDRYRLLTGETYKLRLLPEEDLIHMEEGALGTRALVRHHKRRTYDAALTVTVPTIEELMYFETKRDKKRTGAGGGKEK